MRQTPQGTKNVDHSFIEQARDYIYWVYLAAVGYIGWNHKRVDSVIEAQGKTEQKVNDLKEDLQHVRQGVDRLTEHLLDKAKKQNK